MQAAGMIIAMWPGNVAGVLPPVACFLLHLSPVPPTATTTTARATNFTRYAWGVLAANLLVILWGAYVRASGSGAGCGSHWPLCNGDVVPHSPGIQTMIEFTHRVMSGVALIAVVVLGGWSVLLFPPRHRVRKATIYAMVFFAAEALLGAGLVLLQLVAQDASAGRAFYLAMHLVNTEFLLAALALSVWFSRDDAPAPSRPSTMIASSLALAILVSITGVIAALGDTLFPAGSLAEGMRQDLSSGASFLIRLRSAHPFLAVLAAAYFIAVAVSVMRSKPSPVTTQLALGVLVLSVAQLCAGAINLALLAPITMQIVHLLLADLLWIALVLLTVQVPAQAIRES
jgi:cytochrome c oxidase assembly protein subunit 15